MSLLSVLEMMLSLKIALVAEIVPEVPKVILTYCSISTMVLIAVELLVPPKRKGTLCRTMTDPAKAHH
jgi:uncharacterized membrane protein